MVDLYNFLNSGALKGWNPQQNRATFNINTSGIQNSIPNNEELKMLKSLKNFGKGAGIVTTAVPFYKDFAFPVANDMYNFIQGNPEKSKLLKFAIDMINGGKSSSTSKSNDLMNQLQQDNGAVPFEEITPPQTDVSDLQNIQTNKLPIQNRQSLSNNTSIQAQQPDFNNVLNGGVTVNSENIEEILNKYIQQLQDKNGPYIKALEEYIKKYPKLLAQSGRNDLYFYGANLAKGLDPRAGQKFDQVKNYADMVNTVKALQDAKYENIDEINKLRGNMEVMNELGLPAESALADKNVLNAYLLADRYNKGYLNKYDIAQLNNATKLQLGDLRYNQALAQQLLKNQGGATNAMLYSLPNYMSPEEAVQYMSAVGLLPNGQPVAKNTQQNEQSVKPNTLEEKYSKYSK